MTVSLVLYHTTVMIVCWAITASFVFAFFGMSDENGWAPLVTLLLAVGAAATSIAQWFI